MGSTVSFSENPAIAGATVTVTIENVSMSGGYDINISGTDGDNTAMADVELTVFGAPEASVLDLPANGATNQPVGFPFVWTGDDDAASFQLQIATDANFDNIVIEETTTATVFNISGLAFSTTYYWQVIAINDCGTTVSAESFSFVTVPDLSFDASPSSTVACQAESPEFTLSISDGFMDPSNLSYSVTPNQALDIEYDVDPDNVPTGGNVVVTVNNLFDVPTGIYTITFLVNDGKIQMKPL